MIRKILCSVMFLLTSVSAFATDIPELTTRSTFMGEVKPTAEQKEALDSALKSLEDESKIHMAVLVVDSIKPSSIEEFSMKVAEKWKLGMKGVDNGTLLIVATKDRKARIEVGKGLEGTLTDAMTRRIQKEEMIPFFKKGDFVGGIIAAVEGVRSVTKAEIPMLTNAIETKKAQAESSDSGFGLIIVLIFVGIPSLIVVYFSFFKRKPTPSQKALDDYAAMMASYPMRPTPPRAPSAPRAPSVSSSPRRSSSSRSSRSSDDSYSRSSSSYSSGYSSSSSSSSYSSDSSSSSSSSTSSGGGDFGGGGSSSDW